MNKSLKRKRNKREKKTEMKYEENKISSWEKNSLDLSRKFINVYEIDNFEKHFECIFLIIFLKEDFCYLKNFQVLSS